MKHVKTITTALALLILLHCTGCSWIFMDRAPTEYQNTERIDCSGSGWAVVDTLIAVSSLALAGLQIYTASSYEPDEDAIFQMNLDGSLWAVGIGNLVGGLIHAASAGTGYHWAGKCTETKKQQQQWLRDQRPASRIEQLEQSIEEAKKKLKENEDE